VALAGALWLAACAGSDAPEPPSPAPPPGEPVGSEGPAEPAPPAPADGEQEIALTLSREAVFDLVVALPPAAAAMDDPPPDTHLFHDPDTGLVVSLERRGGGELWGELDLEQLAGRAAAAQGADGPGEILAGRLGDAPAVQIDFRAGGAATSTCVAWRNGSLYLLGLTDPSGGDGVSELLRLLAAATTFTSEVRAAPPPGPDPWAELGVKLPAARGLSSRVEGVGGRVTDVAAGFVTVFAGFPVDESPYVGLDGMALSGRLESEGCSVAAADVGTIAGRVARRARCVLGSGGPRPEYALLHVVAADRYEWVVSVVGASDDWAAAEAYAARLLGPDAVLP